MICNRLSALIIFIFGVIPDLLLPLLLLLLLVLPPVALLPLLFPLLLVERSLFSCFVEEEDEDDE